MKISIFLDFWNFILSFKKIDPQYRADWFAIPTAFLEQVKSQLKTEEATLQDFHVFGSYSPGEQDKGLRNWIASFLPKVPGSCVHFLERQKKSSGPTCTRCHAEVSTCPHCGGSMLGTQEKCVDTLLATTMLQEAWLGKYEIAVLASNDKDFIPAVDFLRNKGIQTIHAGFMKSGMELTKHCWGAFDIYKIREQIRLSPKI